IRIWSRGVDRRQYHPGRRDWGWRQSLGIGADEVVLLFVGRLVLEKGLDVLAALSDTLEKRGVSHKVMIVGEGPERAPMQERLPNAIFTGFLAGDDLSRAYASSDIFINPSTTEAFGNVTLEAMASGLPGICADATGSRSLIVSGSNGYLVTPTSLEDYVNRTADLITNDNLRRQMGAAGRKLSAQYDWDNVMETLVGHYREVLARQAATSACTDETPEGATAHIAR
ncbi:MAG TPA: glycosyltransferase, partial [Pedomonas sp.]|uniref:glycosyltransferase n=1 Tax=Pedomonas sp. TaxID=2976421 RepID=UPI002F42F430